MRSMVLAVAVFAVLHDRASAQVTLDTITVTAVAVDGDNPPVSCAGAICAGLVEDLIDSNQYELTLMDPPLGPESDERFCSLLRDAAPDNCDADEPSPSAPGSDPNWRPNGCGPSDSDWMEIAIDIALNDFPLYTGDPDNPVPGAHFTSACNAHDECWGRGNGFDACNGVFEASLTTACFQVPYCGDYIHAYTAAVESGIGEEIWKAAVKIKTCAAWHRDLEINNCNN